MVIIFKSFALTSAANITTLEIQLNQFEYKTKAINVPIKKQSHKGTRSKKKEKQFEEKLNTEEISNFQK